MQTLLRAEVSTHQSKWLVSKPIDLLFVCGLAPWILGLIAWGIATGAGFKPSAQMHALTMFIAGASLLIGESHQFTSILRYYFNTNSRRRGSFMDRLPLWALYTFLLLIIGMVLTNQTLVTNERLVRPIQDTALIIGNICFIMFPVFLAQHFCAQAKAIGLMYCGKEGYRLTRLMRWNLNFACFFLVFGGALTVALPFGVSPFVATSPFLQFIREIGSVIGFVAVALFAIPTVYRGLLHEEWPPLTAALTWCNLALFFLVPAPFMTYVWFFVPVFYHASQHWSVAWSTEENERRAQGIDATADTQQVSLVRRLFQFAAPIQVVSLAVLFVPLFLARAITGTTPEGATLDLNSSMLVFYIHYVTDRIVWRPTKQEVKHAAKVSQCAV